MASEEVPTAEVYAAAVGAHEGEVAFHVNHTRSGFSGLSPHGERGDRIELVRAPQVTLDRVLGDRDVAVLKIDVEGHELDVLAGATRLLERSRALVVFECTASGLATAQSSAGDLFDFMTRHGYRICLPADFAHGDRALDRAEFARSHSYPFRALNFLAVPETPVEASSAPPEQAEAAAGRRRLVTEPV